MLENLSKGIIIFVILIIAGCIIQALSNKKIFMILAIMCWASSLLFLGTAISDAGFYTVYAATESMETTNDIVSQYGLDNVKTVMTKFESMKKNNEIVFLKQ